MTAREERMCSLEVSSRLASEGCCRRGEGGGGWSVEGGWVRRRCGGGDWL